VGLNPFAAGFFSNPYEQYRDLREHAPVHQSPFGPWLLTRYDDCVRLLRDPRTSVEERRIFDRRAVLFGEDDPRRVRGTAAILNLDPPDHTRLRRLATKAFSPRRIEALGARIQQLVDELLDHATERAHASPDHTFDVISELAFPLPFAVISELLGMPDADRDALRDVSHTLVLTLEPLTPPEAIPRLIAASDAMAAHVDDAIEWKRAHPADDLLSALIAVEEEGDRMSPLELRDQVTLLYVAGHETTVNLVGNGMLALLHHPEQLARLRDDPTLIANAVDELLRFDGPVQFSRRIVLEDLTIDDVVIERHNVVLIGLGAANHDPAHFGADADALDITRPLAPQHLAFGGGIHHCLGAALARVEGDVALSTIVRRLPKLELAGEPERRPNFTLRGLARLPVSF
jgi:cytochrome P450